MTPYPPRYFADENALGLAKELLGRGTELVHPGHPDFPEVPRGAPDWDWLPIVGERELNWRCTGLTASVRCGWAGSGTWRQ